MLSTIKSSIVFRSTLVISAKDRIKILIVVLLQMFFSLLDLIGVAIIGVLGALAVSGIQSSQPGNRVNSVLTFLSLENQTLQFQVLILGITAAGLFISRTVFSIIFTRKILHFLSLRCAIISKELIRRILSQDLISIRLKSIQETVYTVTTGVNSIVLGIIGVMVNLVSDVSLLIVLVFGLIIIDPTMALFSFVIFSLIAVILYKMLNGRAQKYGQMEANLSIKSNEKIVEAIESYRELFVRNQRGHYVKEIGEIRARISFAAAEISFLPFINKYIVETAMVIVALLVSAIQFKTQNAVHAVASLSVFLAAGSRIVPAILRVQQAALAVKGSVGSAGPALDAIETLHTEENLNEAESGPVFSHQGFEPSIRIENLVFSYSKSTTPTLVIPQLIIQPGSMVAIVGPSGAGKTTLVDLILGVIPPSSGTVLISGMPPRQAINSWPGAIGYVAQDVIIANTSIRGNVELGFNEDHHHDARIYEAIHEAHLTDLVNSFELGLNEPVGEKGTKLSGGERQRLGIARALFTNPEVLILDEATSALDASTEEAISKTITGMRRSKTVVLVAHRLSTVQSADLVIYLEAGKVLSLGSFDFVRSEVPNFDKNAKLLGI